MNISIKYKIALPLVLQSLVVLTLIASIVIALQGTDEFNNDLSQRYLQLNHIRSIEIAANQLALPHLKYAVSLDNKSKRQLRENLYQFDRLLDELVGKVQNNSSETHFIDFLVHEQKQIKQISNDILKFADSDYQKVVQLMEVMAVTHLKPTQEKLSMWYEYKTNQIDDTNTSILEQYKYRMNYVIYSLMGMILLFAYAHWFNQRTVINPVLKLSKSIQRIVSGVYKEKLLVSGNDEFCGLAANINSVATSLDSMYTKLNYLANTDQITGIKNRMSLEKTLELEIRNTLNSDLELAVVMFDIDHFAHINDRYGRMIGDEILRQVSELCHQDLRSCDHLFCYEGEKFLIILPNVNHEGAWQAVERCRRMIQKYQFIVDVCEVNITASFGIAYCPFDGTTQSGLITQADKALYLAKQTGRNKSAKFEETELVEELAETA